MELESSLHLDIDGRNTQTTLWQFHYNVSSLRLLFAKDKYSHPMNSLHLLAWGQRYNVHAIEGFVVLKNVPEVL